MKTTITAKKMQIPTNFTEYAEKRIDSRLGKFFGEDADAKIVISEIKTQIVLELTVKYNSIIFRAERSAEDKYVALDDAIDKIIRQIRKNKTKLSKRIREGALPLSRRLSLILYPRQSSMRLSSTRSSR